MGETIEAEADVQLGEAIRPSAAAQARVYRGEFGGTIALAVPFIGGIVAGSIAGMAVSMRFPALGSWPTSILSLLGMVVGLFLGLRLYSRRHLTGFLSALGRMGSPSTFPTRFLFDQDGIRTENDRMSHRIAWPAVLFVVSEKEHWLIQVDTMTIAVPRRAFTDAAAEQAFLDLAEARLSSEARGRSVLKKQ